MFFSFIFKKWASISRVTETKSISVSHWLGSQAETYSIAIYSDDTGNGPAEGVQGGRAVVRFHFVGYEMILVKNYSTWFKL